MRKKRSFLSLFTILFVSSAALIALFAILRGNDPAVPATAAPEGCGIADLNCDDRIDILDLQQIGAAYGAITGTAVYSSDMDLVIDGQINQADLYAGRPGWRSDLGIAQLAGGLPRMGYAVDPDGNVFLRWNLPPNPYSMTVQVLRDPPPAGAPPSSVIPNAGIVAEVAPIYTPTTAVALLGDWANVLRTGLTATTNISGEQETYTVTSVAEMHDLIEAGSNPFLVNQLSNVAPGVALVLGRGYSDTHFSSTGVYTYWARVSEGVNRGQLLGPLVVTTTARTRLPRPQQVDAFEGDLIVPAPGVYSDNIRLRMLRGADASLFLTWNLALDQPASDPVWHVGFNVYRAICAAPYSGCSAFVRQNDLPIFPKKNPSSTYAVEQVGTLTSSLQFDTETHEFEWYWADQNLTSGQTYCYRVAGRDLLGQAGLRSAPSAQSCGTAPDYRPPGAPEIITAALTYDAQLEADSIRLTYQTVTNTDISHYNIYLTTDVEEPFPSGWGLGISQTHQGGPQQTFTDSITSSLPVGLSIWFRLTAVDQTGNESIPSAPVRIFFDDRRPPARPQPSQCINGDLIRTCPPENAALPADTAFVRVYRRFVPDGFPLLIDRVAYADWPGWQDSYEPQHETVVYYTLVAEDAVGNLSPPSVILTDVLAAPVTHDLATPIISDVVISQNGSNYEALIQWTTAGEQNQERFKLYRASGPTPPASTADMTEIANIYTRYRADLNQRYYEFVDDGSVSPPLRADELYWYRVVAEEIAGPDEAESSLALARYVELDQIDYHPATFFNVIDAYWDDAKGGVVIVLPDVPACCHVVFRSRDGVADFTPITQLFAGLNYLDTDVHPGDTPHYQILRIDGGDNSNLINLDEAYGEIRAASYVFTPTGVPAVSLPPVSITAPDSGLTSVGPPTLTFGTDWVISVTAYITGSTLADMSGYGHLIVQNRPTQTRNIKVTFNNISSTVDGQVQGVHPGGEARALFDNLRVNYPDRLRYYLNNLLLDENGATADITVQKLGADFQRWQFDNILDFYGHPISVTLPAIPITNPQLEFTQLISGSQDCDWPVESPFAVRDWPLLVVPLESYTVTQAGIEFGATCTRYLQKFSGRRGDNSFFPGADLLAYRNDNFLQQTFDSLTATYRVETGLTGSWIHSGTFTYTTAFPFQVHIGSAAREFTFENGRLSHGQLLTGHIRFNYDHQITSSSIQTFTGSFTRTQILPNGALSGTIQPSHNINWTSFALNRADFTLYVPPPLTPDEPIYSWRASLGDAASGLSGDSSHQPGLNAHAHRVRWSLCPNIIADNIIFPYADGDDLVDLYVRRSGVTGFVDMALDPEVTGAVSGYDLNINRFAFSWLDNWDWDSATAGDLYLPYPADVEFRFDTVNLDENGCFQSGQTLPDKQQLDYWQLPITPWAVELRDSGETTDPPLPPFPVYKLWAFTEMGLDRLSRLDGDQVEDPLVEADLAFNPDGAFYDAELFPEDTVYRADGFYVVMQDLRLSKYESDEIPTWNGRITIEEPPCLPQNSLCGPSTPGLNGGYIELTAGVYFPRFGEVTDPNNDHIFLLGAHPYVGFDTRPQPDADLSAAMPVNMAYEMAYAQAYTATLNSTPSRWVGLATVSSRDIDRFSKTVLNMPHSLIVEPDEMRFLFGFPAVAGLFLAADEAHTSWPDNPAATTVNDLEDRFESWRNELKLLSTPYDTEDRMAASLKLDVGFSDYTDLIDDINNDIPADGDVVAWINSGGLDTSGSLILDQATLFPDILANGPMQIQWLRGEAIVDPILDGDGRIIDGTLDEIDISSFIQFYTGNGDLGQPPLLEVPLSLLIDPQGEITLEATGIKGTLLDPAQKTTLDLVLLLEVGTENGFHGSMTLKDLETAVADVKKVNAVAGFTVLSSGQIGQMYVGGSLDLNLQLAVIGKINVGGSLLFGRLDPGNSTLQAEYGDLFDDMNAAPGTILEGVYLRAYANNIPIFQVGKGCFGIDITGGGELAFWLFTEAGQSDTAWGTRLGVNAMGDAFCVASAKADITLQLDNDFGEEGLDLTGNAWAGAGCGSCEPEEWDKKADVRNDKWCLKCIIDLHFVIPLAGSNSKSEFTFDAECPF